MQVKLEELEQYLPIKGGRTLLILKVAFLSCCGYILLLASQLVYHEYATVSGLLLVNFIVFMAIGVHSSRRWTVDVLKRNVIKYRVRVYETSSCFEYYVSLSPKYNPSEPKDWTLITDGVIQLLERLNGEWTRRQRLETELDKLSKNTDSLLAEKDRTNDALGNLMEVVLTAANQITSAGVRARSGKLAKKVLRILEEGLLKIQPKDSQ